MTAFRKIYFCVLVFVLPVSLHAQRHDYRTWVYAEMDYDITQRINVSLSPEIRLWDNSSRLDAILTEVSAGARVAKFLTLGLNYRYELDCKRTYQTIIVNRFGIYITANKRLGDFRLAYRLVYHHEYTDMYTSELGLVPLIQHRHRITVRYRKKGWDITPRISAEMFYTLSPSWSNDEEKLRITAGVRYRLTKKINLGLDYKFQQEYYQSNPLTSHIVSVGAEFGL